MSVSLPARERFCVFMFLHFAFRALQSDCVSERRPKLEKREEKSVVVVTSIYLEFFLYKSRVRAGPTNVVSLFHHLSLPPSPQTRPGTQTKSSSSSQIVFFKDCCRPATRGAAGILHLT